MTEARDQKGIPQSDTIRFLTSDFWVLGEYADAV